MNFVIIMSGAFLRGVLLRIVYHTWGEMSNGIFEGGLVRAPPHSVGAATCRPKFASLGGVDCGIAARRGGLVRNTAAPCRGAPWCARRVEQKLTPSPLKGRRYADIALCESR